MKEQPTTLKNCACGCGEKFQPNRHWQKYLNKKHQTEHWLRTHPRVKVA